MVISADNAAVDNSRLISDRAPPTWIYRNLDLRRPRFYEKNSISSGESLVGPKHLESKDISIPMASITGFPWRALRDPELTVDDFRVLICIGARTGADGRPAADIEWIVQQSGLPRSVAHRRLEGLRLRGYLQIRHDGGDTVLGLVSDLPDDTKSAPSRPHTAAATPSQRRGASRSGQASLHSGMLRRPARRQTGAIEFEDPLPTHPVVASLQDSVQHTSGGVDGFRFWLKTILDPEDVEVFSGWAGRQSAAYRQLVSKFDSADDDGMIESLLEDTLALVKREKQPNR